MGTTHLDLKKAVDTNKTWGDGIRENFDVLDRLHSPAQVFFVDADYNESYLLNGSATTQKHFETIQEAIDAAPSGLPSSYANRALILVHPGYYEECLEISKNVTIAAIGGPQAHHYGAKVTIAGSGDASPAVTVSIPDAASFLDVGFSGISIENKYTSGATQTKAACLRIDKALTDTGGTSRVHLLSCSLLGEDNGNTDWESVIENYAAGDARIYLDGCMVGAVISGTGRVRSLVKVAGDYSNSKLAYLIARDTSFYLDGGPYTNYGLIAGVNGSTSILKGCDFNEPASSGDAYMSMVGSGVNTFTGITGASEATQYVNAMNIANLLFWE